MIWFFIILGCISVLGFFMLCSIDWINQRKAKDPIFNAKVEKFFEKTDPFFNFMENLFGWVLVGLFIYYIALG